MKVAMQGRRKSRPPRACHCGDHAFAPTSAWGIVLVSPDDAWLLSGYVWTLSIINGVAYAFSSRHRRETRHHYLHCALLEAAEGQRRDHRNGHGLDNRRPNLRVATHADNMRNSKQRDNNKVGFKGVHRDERQPRRPYVAAIMVDRKSIFLGSYSTASEAAHAYDRAAKQHHGEFARLNFPT